MIVDGTDKPVLSRATDEQGVRIETRRALWRILTGDPSNQLLDIVIP